MTTELKKKNTIREEGIEKEVFKLLIKYKKPKKVCRKIKKAIGIKVSTREIADFRDSFSSAARAQADFLQEYQHEYFMITLKEKMQAYIGFLEKKVKEVEDEKAGAQSYEIVKLMGEMRKWIEMLAETEQMFPNMRAKDSPIYQQINIFRDAVKDVLSNNAPELWDEIKESINRKKSNTIDAEDKDYEVT